MPFVLQLQVFYDTGTLQGRKILKCVHCGSSWLKILPPISLSRDIYEGPVLRQSKAWDPGSACRELCPNNNKGIRETQAYH